MEVANTNLPALQLIQTWLAAGYITVDKANNRPVYHLRITNYRDIYRIASLLKGFCTIKRRHLALMTELMQLILERYGWNPKRRNVNTRRSSRELSLIGQLRAVNGRNSPSIQPPR